MHDAEEARWILVAARARTDRRLGFASFSEYLERLFGYSLRRAREKLRVAQALEVLPETMAALAAGAIHWSCARELTRVAIAETEHAWLEAARGASMREVEELVSGHAPGDLPGDPRDPKAELHTIHARVSAETMAMWREAISFVRKASDGTLSEDEIIQQIARAALGGPKDDGRASYQIVLTRCEDCGRTTQRGCGKELVVDAAVLEAAECDAQRIDLDETPVPRATQEIPPATRRFVLHRDQHRCVVPGCRNATFLDVHHLHARSKGGDHHPDRLVTLCGAHHKQVHDGRLVIEGDCSSGLVFRHANGNRYGTPTLPTIASDVLASTSVVSDVFIRARQPED